MCAPRGGTSRAPSFRRDSYRGDGVRNVELGCTAIKHAGRTGPAPCLDLCGRRPTASGIFSDVIALPHGTPHAYYNCEVGTFFNIKATAIRSATSKDGLVWLKDPGERINPLDGPEITGYDGLPKLGLPKGQDPIAPPVCQLCY